MRRAFSSVFWAFLVVSSVALFPIAVSIWLVTGLFDPRLRALHRFTCFWASLYSWLNPAWRVSVENVHKIRRDETYVMVANHQSLLDILVLFRIFAHFKWVSKIENFRIPFVGWNMWLNRYIRLKRGDRASVVRMLRECEETLAEGSSIMMFPEGTRSPDGRLRAFKPGAFTLAQSARRPILPIVIQGTANALPKRGFVLQGRHPIRITVLDEIPYASFADEPVEALSDRIRSLIESRLEPQPSPPATATSPARPSWDRSIAAGGVEGRRRSPSPRGRDRRRESDRPPPPPPSGPPAPRGS
ncbi:MAG: 1-acyl-sn-glycerol-3-phosphate acyltransferase [Myxococcales bacterium]|nr:1-acyl-sn-glycerol-3-phosphate acyltransferase [Myxococcales bacterium]